jgi:hypothetical protein
MPSRWRDFLTSDGEKPDRDRDREFELELSDTRSALMEQWNEGWSHTLAAIRALNPDDLERTVTIRGEPHTVLGAINRQLTHYASHVGQIVYLAKQWAGPSWKTLTIPRGRSRDYEVSKNGEAYGVKEESRDGAKPGLNPSPKSS